MSHCTSTYDYMGWVTGQNGRKQRLGRRAHWLPECYESTTDAGQEITGEAAGQPAELDRI